MDAIVPAENNFALSLYKTVNVSIKWLTPAVNRTSRKRAAGYPVR
jgi:hypothetical protein